MKTAGRENPIHGVRVPRNRAHGAVGQNRSRSIKWAAKQEKFQPEEMCFFLTSPFIELPRNWRIPPSQTRFLTGLVVQSAWDSFAGCRMLVHFKRAVFDLLP